jgi:protein TonB
MKYILLLIGLLLTSQASGQLGHYTDTVINGKVYHHVDEPPFEGLFHYVEQMPEAGYDCTALFMKHFRYPDSLTKAGYIVDRIVVTFVVNEDGKLSDFKVLKGKEMEKEVLRVMRKMPTWKPGRQNGKPVKIWYTLPIIIGPK